MGFWADLLRVFRRRKPSPPQPPPFDEAGARATCEAIWREDLGREIDDVGLEGCLNQARAGGTAETIQANVRASDEYRARQDVADDPVPPFVSRLRVDGRRFINDAGATFRPVFASALTLLARSAHARAEVLDELQALGFNGVRVFAGRLSWAQQSPALVRAVLPSLLAEAKMRGLYVLVSALTDTRGGGYDERAHLEHVAAITAMTDNVLLEVANEPYHGTQSDLVQNVDWLRDAARDVLAGYPHPWAIGAAKVDEPIDGRYPTAGGLFDTAHLDRSRDRWNQVRRVREIYAIADVTGRPALNSEPLGAAEVAIRGKRETHPSFFFALGVLNRGFEVGGVFHSEDGLFARPLGPVQRACAEAFLAGSRAAGTHARLRYLNARHAGSPVVDADFVEAGGPIVRAYSFVSGTRGITVVLSERPTWNASAVQFGNGWRVTGTIAQRDHVSVLRVEQ